MYFISSSSGIFFLYFSTAFFNARAKCSKTGNEKCSVITLSFPLGERQNRVKVNLFFFELMEKLFTETILKRKDLNHLTVTDLAKFRGLSGSFPLATHIS